MELDTLIINELLVYKNNKISHDILSHFEGDEER